MAQCVAARFTLNFLWRSGGLLSSVCYPSGFRRVQWERGVFVPPEGGMFEDRLCCAERKKIEWSKTQNLGCDLARGNGLEFYDRAFDSFFFPPASSSSMR